MSVWILITGACILVSVKTHPLVQNIQPYPITNYQQHVYRSPYSEAYIVQPTNMNDYTQTPPVQIPVPTYQNLQTPTLPEQIIQLYWDKLMSNPSLRKLLVPNKIAHNWYGEDKQKISHSCDTGGVVNNYIIMPSDYLTVNDTVFEQPETKKVRNKLRKPVKKHDTTSRKKKTVLSNKRVHVDDSQLSDIKTQRKVKQSAEKYWNFNTDNIKCFTPADVLKSEKYQPEEEVRTEVGRKNRNKVKNKCYTENSKIKSKSSTVCENKNRKQKSRNTRKNNTQDTVNKRRKQSKKWSRICKCAKKCELSECKPNVSERNTEHCKQDIDDLLLSNLVQQDCINVENRHTRNSNADTAMKDIRSMYPDLPNDLSKTLTWYMNDLFSPHTLQQAFSSNSFLGNSYPFDFSQIYQIPTFSNVKVNNPNGNAEKNSNTRRKKKKKKHSKPRTKENSSNDDNSDYLEIIEKNIQIPETSVQITDTSLISAELSEKNTYVLKPSTQISEIIYNPDINITVSEKNTYISPIAPVKVSSVYNETKTSEFITAVPKTITTDIVSFNPMISSEKLLNDMKHRMEEVLENKNVPNWNQNSGSGEEESEETYETQIPYSVVINNNNENNFEVPNDEISNINHMLFTLDPNKYNHFRELESEDEIFKMFMKEYYPDFRAYNHAYLASDDELDVRNIHDRYFYVTDRNIDTKDFFLPDQDNQLPKEAIYTDDELRHYNIFEHNDNKNIVKKDDTSQEIVFRIPPGLEVPDFITRKINRDSHDSREINYQLDNSEDDTNKFNLQYFADNSDKLIQGTETTSDDKSGHLVETVYARSKVVKYGQSQESNKSSKSETKTDFPKLDNGATHNDRETTVVIAKSVRPEEYHY